MGEPEQIIADYMAAFRAANPTTGCPVIAKRPGGWWGYRSAGSSYVSPKRLRDIVAMNRAPTSPPRQGERRPWLRS